MNITKKLMLAAGLFLQLSSLHADNWADALELFGGLDVVKENHNKMDLKKVSNIVKGNQSPEVNAVALYVAPDNAAANRLFKAGVGELGNVESHLNPVVSNVAQNNAPVAAKLSEQQMNDLRAANAAAYRASGIDHVDLGKENDDIAAHLAAKNAAKNNSYVAAASNAVSAVSSAASSAVSSVSKMLNSPAAANNVVSSDAAKYVDIATKAAQALSDAVKAVPAPYQDAVKRAIVKELNDGGVKIQGRIANKTSAAYPGAKQADHSLGRLSSKKSKRHAK